MIGSTGDIGAVGTGPRSAFGGVIAVGVGSWTVPDRAGAGAAVGVRERVDLRGS